MSEDNLEKVGILVDRLENLAAILQIPMNPLIHIDQMQKVLPELAEELKTIYKEESGENPWE
jgi:hypothetical protein